MRPPTEVERLAVFLAAMTVTRLLLARRRAATPEPAEPRRVRAVFVNGRNVTGDPRYDTTEAFRARYGADNPGAN